MLNTTINNAAKNFASLVNQTINEDEIINVATDEGNVIIISESIFRDLVLAAEVNVNQEFRESLLHGLKAPLADFVDEGEVSW